mmetsp:Transcript_11962/g.32278  ORF Transcript_11962/g.32278 Transcript_11962/m.32278 type:complete len:522 (+) Transcript_11962:310-1875(+)
MALRALVASLAIARASGFVLEAGRPVSRSRLATAAMGVRPTPRLRALVLTLASPTSSSSPSSEVPYEKMKVAELKKLLLEAGGKPGQLRKSQLVEALQSLDASSDGGGRGGGESGVAAGDARFDGGRDGDGRASRSQGASSAAGRMRMASLDLAPTDELLTAGVGDGWAATPEEQEVVFGDDLAGPGIEPGSDGGSGSGSSGGGGRERFGAAGSGGPIAELLDTLPPPMTPLGPDHSRVNRTVLLGEEPAASMELKFIGTASCIPSTTRGVSCTVLRRNGAFWMFDAGEGTQINLQRSGVRPSRIEKIFVTHAHGDHTFGLAGVLCLMGQDFDRTTKVVDIYGPKGLRAYLRAAMQLTLSRVTPPYRVHEVHGVPFLHGQYFREKPPEPPNVPLAADSRFGEVEGGTDIWPDADGCWSLVDQVDGGDSRGGEEGVMVRAAPMQHTVPCVGFAVTERSRPGKLDAARIKPLLAKNDAALKAKVGEHTHAHSHTHSHTHSHSHTHTHTRIPCLHLRGTRTRTS